jgi:hypothetical protein
VNTPTYIKIDGEWVRTYRKLDAWDTLVYLTLSALATTGIVALVVRLPC